MMYNIDATYVMQLVICNINNNNNYNIYIVLSIIKQDHSKCTHTLTQAHHTKVHYTQFLTLSLQVRPNDRGRQQCERGKHSRSIVLEKEMKINCQNNMFNIRDCHQVMFEKLCCLMRCSVLSAANQSNKFSIKDYHQVM